MIAGLLHCTYIQICKAFNHKINNLYNNHIDTSICLRELDPDWNILWQLAARGQVVIQKCPGGAESVGMYACIKT